MINTVRPGVVQPHISRVAQLSRLQLTSSQSLSSLTPTHICLQIICEAGDRIKIFLEYYVHKVIIFLVKLLTKLAENNFYSSSFTLERS